MASIDGMDASIYLGSVRFIYHERGSDSLYISLRRLREGEKVNRTLEVSEGI